MKERHVLLFNSISFFKEEHDAMKTVTILIVGFTSYVVIGTLFEAIFFSLYNSSYHPFAKILVCASILHWLGNISKLPNQCKNICNIFFAFENYPINVKCLHIGYVQAFYLDWVVFKIYLGSFQYGNLPNQCKMLAHNLCASILH